MIAQTLHEYKVDPRDAFERAGLDFDQLGSRGAYFSQNTITRLWNLSEQLTNDPYFGIKAV